MLLLTIAVVFVLFVISYMIFDKDLLAPPTVVSLVFLFSCLCALYNEERWGMVFSSKSLGIIAAGIIATIIGGMIGAFLYNLRRGGSFSFLHTKTEAQLINVSGEKTFLVIVFQVVTIILIITHILRVTELSNWISAITTYRGIVTRTAENNDYSMSILTKNMAEFSRSAGIVYAYIVGNNLVAAKKKISLIWVPVLLYTATTFLLGDRSNMIRLWVVALVTAYTIHRRSVGWERSRETVKIIRRMAISVVAIGVIFVGFRGIVGRTEKSDPFYYLTFYAGSPIAVLNQVWDSAIVKPAVFGQRILFYFNQSTTALFGFPGKYVFYYPYFYSSGGAFIGNAPTAFRPAFVEFGFWGFFLFFVIMGAFFTVFYCKCRERKGRSPIDMRLLIYAYVAYVFFMYFYSTFFDFLSHVFIKYVIEFLVIRWALFDLQIAKRAKR